jgi:hypothetical protein
MVAGRSVGVKQSLTTDSLGAGVVPEAGEWLSRGGHGHLNCQRGGRDWPVHLGRRRRCFLAWRLLILGRNVLLFV